jgi:hypothetical protein
MLREPNVQDSAGVVISNNLFVELNVKAGLYRCSNFDPLSLNRLTQSCCKAVAMTLAEKYLSPKAIAVQKNFSSLDANVIVRDATPMLNLLISELRIATPFDPSMNFILEMYFKIADQQFLAARKLTGLDVATGATLGRSDRK